MLLGDLTLPKFEYIEIYPHIFIYKNLFPDHKRLYDVLKESSINGIGKYLLNKWKDWFVFGSYVDEKDISFQQNSILVDSKKQEISETDGFFNEELYLVLRVKGAVNRAMCHYIGANNVDLPHDAYMTKPNYAKYYPDVTLGFLHDQELTMNYHTDYLMGEWFWENQNFLITSTTYMNDDYESGEISFFIDGDIVTYKPEAGDVLVFPSGSPLYAPAKNPYFHGVQKIKSGEKYLIRTYVKYPQKGNDLWHKNVEKYGIEEWKKIAHDISKNQNSLAFEHNSDKIKRTYNNMTVWESPLVNFLYKKD